MNRIILAIALLLFGGIRAQGQSCTTYGNVKYCSRADTNVTQMDSPLPNVGTNVGANTVVTPADFGNPIVRLTDANLGLVSMNLGTAGSADENIWNTDSTLLATGNSGGHHYIWSFDTVSMKATQLWPNLSLNNAGTATPSWSRQHSQILFTESGPVIYQYDFTNRSVQPTPTVFYDFTSSPNCLPHGYSPQWYATGGSDVNDSTFAMAFSNTGGQGTGVDIVVYRPGQGCSHYNTSTGVVSGDFGSSGTVLTSERFTIHNVKLERNGHWLVIVDSNCTGGTCAIGPHFWEIGTLNVNDCGSVTGTTSCQGHWTEGFGVWENSAGGPCQAYNEGTRSPFLPGTVLILTTAAECPPQNMPTPHDSHESWNTDDISNTMPVIASHIAGNCNGCTMTYAWEDEIDGYVQGKVFRFAHTYNTQQSQRFDAKIAVESESQDGRFVAFTSDWQGKLGSEAGGVPCTLGTNCRSDVFIVKIGDLAGSSKVQPNPPTNLTVSVH